jgi:hypothetical protein
LLNKKMNKEKPAWTYVEHLVDISKYKERQFQGLKKGGTWGWLVPSSMCRRKVGMDEVKPGWPPGLQRRGPSTAGTS